MKRGIILLVALTSVPAFADEIQLRGGGRITGQILEQTEESVTVDIGGGTITAAMSSVVGIERSVSPLQEYRARAAEIPAGDVEAWRELARWASRRALSSQAWEAWGQVLAILPEDEEANRALGRVRLDGRWVDEEESYRAQGYVEFEGQWMRPEEQRAILAERQAEEEAARRDNEAAIRAIEAEQAAERAREAQEAAQGDSWDRMNETVYWGWGYGPAVWPQPSTLGSSSSSGR